MVKIISGYPPLRLRLLTIRLFFFCLMISFQYAGAQGNGHYYEQAVANANVGKYELAIKQLANVIKGDPNNYEAMYNKGYCEAQLQDYTAAIKDFNACLELSPEFPNALYYRGFCYSKLGQYQVALNDYVHAMKYQSNSDLYGSMAFAYLQLKDYENSLKYYDLAMQLKNDNNSYYLDRATCEYFLNKLPRAAQDIDHYLGLKPASPDATELAFRIHYQMHDYAHAEEIAKKLQQYKRKAALGHYFEGMINFDKKDFQKAANNFSLAIKANSKYAEAYFSRGMCYRFLNDKTKACADLNKALALGFTAQQRAVDAYCK